jgi:hypothetical protein
MREVDEARHKAMMLSEEGVEPIELGLHGHERGTDCISFLFPIGLLCFPLAQLSFVFHTLTSPFHKPITDIVYLV